MTLDDYVTRPGFVLIKCAAKREKTGGGIFLSDFTERRQTFGQVVASGCDYVSVGDWAVFLRWAGEPFECDGHEWYVVVRGADVQATIQGTDLNPCPGWCVVKPVDTRLKETESGIILADAGWLHTDPDSEFEGQDLKVEYDPSPIADVIASSVPNVDAGDRIVADPWIGTDVAVAGRDYTLVPKAAILAVLEEDHAQAA